ncbi:MAG: YihA family ribosome biogenesis GTP-binding protein [Saprospiraceae bacterium]|nr:YihA family ribosome biogenesis GTP-binding protein [Saprospiraceae bacterium]
MTIKSAEFSGSFVKIEDCPPPLQPEYAFIGRSNVGKSTLINMLCDKKYLAKVSGTPGKTQTINFFNINNDWRMVDLPGYGYAKVSKSLRQGWSKFTEEYLQKRENLICIFVLIDSNIPTQKIDLQFMRWLAENNLSFVLVYTKLDRLRKTQKQPQIESIQQKILTEWNELPMQFFTSGEKREGKDEILNFIDELNKMYYEKTGTQ